MITGDLKSQIDAVWNAFWTGGISNPLEVIEQITYLLFIKRLDELYTAEEKKANRLGRPIEHKIFKKDEQQLRWSRFKNLEAKEMFEIVTTRVFPFIKELRGEESSYARHMKDARFTIPTPGLLSDCYLRLAKSERAKTSSRLMVGRSSSDSSFEAS